MLKTSCTLRLKPGQLDLNAYITYQIATIIKATMQTNQQSDLSMIYRCRSNAPLKVLSIPHLGSSKGMRSCRRVKAQGQAQLSAVGQCLGRYSCLRRLKRHRAQGSFRDCAKIHTRDGLRTSQWLPTRDPFHSTSHCMSACCPAGRDAYEEVEGERSQWPLKNSTVFGFLEDNDVTDKTQSGFTLNLALVSGTYMILNLHKSFFV